MYLLTEQSFNFTKVLAHPLGGPMFLGLLGLNVAYTLLPMERRANAAAVRMLSNLRKRQNAGEEEPAVNAE